jgi:hypothetical protein
MSRYICKCPYCNDGVIQVNKKNIMGKNVKLYKCSNNKVITEDGEMWEQTADSTCSYKLWGDRLHKYGKRGLGEKEVKTLLTTGQLKVRLVARGTKNVYEKYIIPNLEYGFSVLWDEEVVID